MKKTLAKYSRHIGAGALCAAMILVTVLSGLGGAGLTASALSLPYITQLVTDLSSYSEYGRGFTILEIVPEKDAGSIGYYVPGYEPGSGWKAELAEKTSKAQREVFVNGTGSGIFSQLKAAGLLGTGEDTPLKSQAAYDEKMMWQLDDATGYTQLALKAAETVNLPGQMVPAEGGDFAAQYTYTAWPGGEADRTGYDYSYDFAGIRGFLYLPAEDMSVPTADASPHRFALADEDFTLLDAFEEPESGVGTAMYTKVDGVFTYAMTWGDPDVYPDPDKSYYYIKADVDISARAVINDGSTAGYFPVFADNVDGYRKVGDGEGLFKREINLEDGYTWVAGKKGDFNFEPGSGSTVKINYDKVYYKGGYTNNYWFHKHVLDMDGDFDKAIVTVRSVTPGEVTSMAVEAADMIILSAGYRLDGTPAAQYGVGKDISDTAAYTIFKRASGAHKIPVVVDQRVAQGTEASTAKDLAAFLAEAKQDYEYDPGTDVFSGANLSGRTQPVTDVDKNYVNGNIYCYMPTGAGAPGFLALAGKSFAYNFNGDAAARLGFEAVAEEIEYENFILETGGASERLPIRVSVATALRHVINYGQQRVKSIKTSLNVLEIQPRNGKADDLAKNIAENWLPAGSGITADKITVKTMSIAEFIGRIEDLNETYDMIYIGADLGGFYTNSGKTSFNDKAMNGLIYMNIGDTYRAKFDLAGQLASDYVTSGGTRYIDSSKTSTANLFRFPGNDLTARAADALKAYAAAGYPIVFDAELVSGSSVQAKTFSVNITNTQNYQEGDKYYADFTSTLSAAQLPAGYTAEYQWYNGGAAIPGANQSTLRLDVTGTAAGYSGNITCKLTVDYNGETGVATSNRLAVARTNAKVTVSSTDSGKQQGSCTGDQAVTVTPVLSARTTGNNASAGRPRFTVAVSDYTITAYEYYQSENSDMTDADRVSTNTSYRPGDNISKNTTYYYQAVVTINGTKIKTNIYRHSRGSGNSATLTNMRGGDYCKATLDTTISADKAEYAATDTITLTLHHTLANPHNLSLPGLTHTWQQDGGNATGITLEVQATDIQTAGRTYQVRSRFSSGTRVDAMSNTVTLTRTAGSTTVTNQGQAQNGSLVIGGDTAYSPDGDRVDNCTHLYTLMKDLLQDKNVFALGSAGAVTSSQKSSLISYLNLSKPSINLTAYPTAYNNIGNVMTYMTPDANGVYYLRYLFTISNETDPTPSSTTYDVALFIDANADGRLGDEERLDDIIVRQGGHNGMMMTKKNGKYQLKAGVTYSVVRQMPNDYVGILPWGLKVIKNGAEHIHASQQDFTRIAPAPGQTKEIKVLQILGTRGDVFDLNRNHGHTVVLETNSKYKEWVNQVSDFDIKFTTIRSDGGPSIVSGLARKTAMWGGRVVCPDGVTRDVNTTDEIYEHVLSYYDMIIIGFDDCYGDIDDTTANAIFKYIDSGKAVLFTHDTTSFTNVADKDILLFNKNATDGRNDKKIEGGAYGEAYWGYSFNTILRDPVGLDFYGISSARFGSALRASNPPSAADLQAAGYNVAYKPKSGKTVRLHSTEAYTSFFLNSKPEQSKELGKDGRPTERSKYYRQTAYPNINANYTSNIGGISRNGYITQVNKGQITTYPFNINTKAFGGTATDGINMDFLKVTTTHEQYYQLNMNSQDIVVWYCLSNGENGALKKTSYGNMPNDVSNGYYIYTMGNVTYSGVGHDKGVTDDEAKLFINTMIAAFRTTSTIPEVKLKNEYDAEIEYVYFTANLGESDIIESSFGGQRDESRAVYFSFNDPSISANKTIGASFFYKAGEGETIIDTICYTESGEAVSELKGGVLYKFYLSDGAINALKDRDFVEIIVEIQSSAAPAKGRATAEMRKIGLLELK